MIEEKPVHKVLVQLEEDIQAQAKKNINNAKAGLILDESAVLAWGIMLEKVFSRVQEHQQVQEQRYEKGVTHGTK